jgi:hypothetical protein
MSTMQRPSRAINTVYLLVAALSLGLTTWYLWPFMPIALINLAIAGVIVLAPLLVCRPLSAERAVNVALFWAVVGLPGGFIFGTAVFLGAPVLLVSAYLIHFLEHPERAASRLCLRKACA